VTTRLCMVQILSKEAPALSMPLPHGLPEGQLGEDTPGTPTPDDLALAHKLHEYSLGECAMMTGLWRHVVQHGPSTCA
jgi:hypothetical protein